MADKTVVVRIVLRANQFSSGLAQAGSASQSFASQVSQNTQRAASSSLALGAASATAGKLIVLGIGGAMAVSAKAAIDFESSLTGVAKTTGLAGDVFDTASGPLAAFGMAMRDLALEVPVDVNDLNRIAELGGQLGIQTPALVGFTRTIAALGSATNLSFEEAATGIARLANIMRTPQDEFGRLAGILVDLGNKFAATEAEILTFATRIAPVGVAVGATEENVLALAAGLTSLGIPAERGGTAVQRLLIMMSQAIDEGGDKLTKFAEVAGVSIEDFTDTFRRAPAEAFSLFVKGLDGINKAGGSVFGTLRQLELTEVRTIQVLLAASAGWETIANSIEVADAAGVAQDAHLVEAARRYGTTASQLQILANSFNDLRIEIGGAILGSGGLAASIDFLKEFFFIIKDNLPVLGRLAAILGTIAGIRIIAGLVQSFAAATTAAKTFWTAHITGSRNAGGAMAAARLGIMGLNTAMSLGLTILGGLITAWAIAAASAAQFRREARLLRQEVEGGGDAYDILIEDLRETGVWTYRRLDLLHKLGLSERDIIEHMMGERDILQELGVAVDNAGDGAVAAQEHFESLGLIGEKWVGSDEFYETAEAFQAIFDIIASAAPRVNAQMTETIQSLKSAGLDAGVSAKNVDALARAAIKIFGIDITNEEFLSWLDVAGREAIRLRERFVGVADAGTQAARQISVSWQSALAGRGEEGFQMIDDFIGDVEDSLVDFEEGIEDVFASIREEIITGMPTSADYEQMAELTRTGLQAIIDAQLLYIQDVESWATASSFIQGRVSQDTEDWLNDQDAAFQGALGRLFVEDLPEFERFIDSIDSNFARLSEAAETHVGIALPDAVRTGFQGLVTAIAAGVAELPLSGAEATDAFLFGLTSTLLGMEGETQAMFVAFLLDIFSDPEMMRQLGIDVADPLVQGMIERLSTLGAELGVVADKAINELGAALYESGKIHSPSQLTWEVGEQLAAGLIGGYQTGLELTKLPLLPRQLVEPSSASAMRMMTGNTTTTTYAGTRSFSLNLYGTNVYGSLDSEVRSAGHVFRSIVQMIDHGRGKD